MLPKNRVYKLHYNDKRENLCELKCLEDRQPFVHICPAKSLASQGHVADITAFGNKKEKEKMAYSHAV